MICTCRQEMSCMRVPDILSPMCESSQSSSLGCFSHSYSINVCRMYTDTGLPCNRANEVVKTWFDTTKSHQSSIVGVKNGSAFKW